ncbi:Protein transport protein Sec31A [Hordeum vulgare]|nr:Protein transport protein Sec31A [Hordeum vulgare]
MTLFFEAACDENHSANPRNGRIIYGNGTPVLTRVFSSMDHRCTGTCSRPTGGGTHVEDGAEDAKDLIPINRWLKRVEVPGRATTMILKEVAGRRPRTDHEEGAWEPNMFYVDGVLD